MNEIEVGKKNGRKAVLKTYMELLQEQFFD